MSDLEKRYGFADQLAKLSDEQLVSRFNQEIGNRGSGRARQYFLSCLATEIESRAFDSSVIFSESGLKLNCRVALAGNQLDLVEDTSTEA